MNKKITSSALAALMIAGTTSFTAFAAMENGTVVIGNKAFDLAYANNPSNVEEITNAIVEGGQVYVKDFEGNWINNTTGQIVSASVIPAVVYKGIDNKEVKFDAQDKDVVEVVDSKLAITSVTAINTKTLSVNVNKELVNLEGLTFTAKRGNTAVVLTSMLSNDKKSVQLVSSTSLVAGEYTVTVTGGTFTEGTNAGTVTVASQRIGAIDFSGNVLAKTGTGTATVGFKVYDQYGTDVTGSANTLINNINWSANVAVDSLNDVNGVLTIDLAGATDFVANQTVLITAVDSITGISKSTNFTVGTMSAVRTLSLGNIVLPKESTRIYTGEASAATIAVVAKDQYGNDLDKASKLTGVTVLSSDSAVVPTIVDVDSKPVINLNTTSLTIAKSVTLTLVINATGETVSKTVEIAKPAQADVVTLGILETNVVAASDAAKKFVLPITVVNQFGETLTAKQIVAAGLTITGTGSFSASSLAIETDSTSEKYGKIVNTGVIGAAGVGTIVVTSPTGKTASANYEVKATRKVVEVIAPKTVKTNLVSGATTPVAYQFKDQYGDIVTGLNNADLHYKVVVTDLTGDAGVITSSLTTNGDETDLATASVSAVYGKVGTAKVSAQLLNASDEVVSQYETNFTVVANNADGLIYSVDNIPTLYSNVTAGANVDGTDAYAAAVSFTAKDATGNEFAIPTSQILKVESVKGFFTVNGTGVAPLGDVILDAQDDSFVIGAIDADSLPALVTAFGTGNTATDTLKVTINTASGVKVITKDVTISKEALKAVEMKILDKAIVAADPYALAAGTKDVTALTYNDITAAVAGTANVFVVTKDQYGVYSSVGKNFILNSVNLLTFGAGDSFDASSSGTFKLTDADANTQFTAGEVITFSIVEGNLTDTLTVKITAETLVGATPTTTGSWATKGTLVKAEADDAIITFSEAISVSSKTAVETAIKAGVAGVTGTDLKFVWSLGDTVVTVTNTNTTIDATFAADASVLNVKDLLGNVTTTVTLDLK